MDLTRKIDGYCERTGPEFWAEPVNALSNGAFALAGLYVLLAVRPADPAARFLGWLLMVIGAGSFLFHTFATLWAAMADTGPIMVFILGYFAIAMNRFGGLSWPWAFGAMVGFLVAMGALSALLRPVLMPVIGTSVSYVPALMALAAMAAWLGTRGRSGAARGLLTAALIFAVSLTFRVMDLRVCDAFPLGTHFLWHLCNAAVLLTLTLTLVRHGHPPMNTVVAGGRGR